MEPLISGKAGFQNAARLVLVVGTINPFKIIRRFSARKKPPLLEEQPPVETSKKETTCLQAGRSLAVSGHQETVPLNSNPLPGEKREANTFQKRSWRKFRTQAVPLSNEQEFKNLRKEDFAPRRSKPRQNPFPLERNRGTEILFGTAPCSLALGKSKRTISQLFLNYSRGGTSPTMEKFSQYAKERGIPVKMVPRSMLNVLCQGRIHQGVCLEATPLRPPAWQEGPLRRAGGGAVGLQSLWLVLEGIYDPMNLGAVLRSAHFLGVDGVVLNKRNTCPLTPVVSKASSGFMEVFDVFSTDDLQGLLKAKSEEGWEVLGTVGHKKTQEEIPIVNCLNFRWTRPTILLLGNEGYGLSPETQTLCHRMLTVAPGRELEFGVESLNVSVAAGILLHSICSQRTKPHSSIGLVKDEADRGPLSGCN